MDATTTAKALIKLSTCAYAVYIGMNGQPFVGFLLLTIGIFYS